MTKNTVLLVQPRLRPPGGGEAVAAWLVQALCRSYRMTVLSWYPVDVAALNRHYGTQLREGDFRVFHAPRLLRALFALDPDSLSLQPSVVLWRLARLLHRRFDVVITAQDEGDLGGPGIQYIHYPGVAAWLQRVEQFRSLSYPGRVLSVLRGAHRPWMLLSDFCFGRMRQNLTLVNSDWTGRLTRAHYNIPTTTVYPPVPDVPVRHPWHEREEAFVCLGRWSGDKHIDRVVDIVERVRASGRAVRLHLIASRFDDRYRAEMLQRVAQAGDWITVHENLPRDQMTALLGRVRYGLHGNPAEHFGIAVAEMARAGCIVFVPNDGGQVEIVGHDERLLYSSPAEAAQKIATVLESPELQLELHERLQRDSARFDPACFMERMRDIVQGFLESRREALAGAAPRSHVDADTSWDGSART